MQDQTEHNSSVVKSQINTAVIRGLKPGGIYVFQVRARTVAGFGRYSGKMYFQTMTEGKFLFEEITKQWLVTFLNLVRFQLNIHASWSSFIKNLKICVIVNMFDFKQSLCLFSTQKILFSKYTLNKQNVTFIIIKKLCSENIELNI